MDPSSDQQPPYQPHGLARRMVVYILLFSSLITLLSTSFQLYMDYSHDVSQIHRRLREVETSHLQNIINNVWLTQMDSVRLEMDGILRLPDMHRVAIRLEDGQTIVMGHTGGENLLEQVYPLRTSFRNQEIYLGEFTVTASLQGVYERIRDKVLLILTSQAIKTFLVSLFMIWLFYTMVGRHLHILAEYTLGLRLNQLPDKPPLPYRQRPRDELGQLVQAVGEMVEHLSISYQQIQANNEAMEETIDQLKRTETALQQNQQRLQEEWNRAQAYLNLVAGIFVQLDREGRVELINPLGASLLGRPVQDIVGKNWLDHFVAIPSRPLLQKEMEDLFNGSGSVADLDHEYGVVTSFGLQQEFLWNHRLILDGKGGVKGVISHGMDISERKKMEMALQASESRLRAIIDNSQAIIFVKDMHGYYQQVNKRFLSFFALPMEQVIGKSDYHLMPNEIANQVRKNDAKAMELGCYESEDQLYSAEGMVHTFLSMKFPLQTGEGRPYALCGIATDISEQKRVQWSLERELTINRTLVQLARLMISPAASLQEIAQYLLEESLKLTNSKEGFVGDLDPASKGVRPLATTKGVRSEGQLLFGLDEQGHYPEPLGSSLNQKRPIFYYDFTTDKCLGLLSPCMGYWLTIPVLAGGLVRGQIALANPDHAYSPQDVKCMEMLTELFVLALEG